MKVLKKVTVTSVSGLILSFGVNVYVFAKENLKPTNVESRISFTTEMKNSITKYKLAEMGEGNFELSVNPNTCDEGGVDCTKIQVKKEQGRLIAVKSDIKADAPRVYLFKAYELRNYGLTNTWAICLRGYAQTECENVRASLYLKSVEVETKSHLSSLDSEDLYSALEIEKVDVSDGDDQFESWRKLFLGRDSLVIDCNHTPKGFIPYSCSLSRRADK